MLNKLLLPLMTVQLVSLNIFNREISKPKPQSVNSEISLAFVQNEKKEVHKQAQQGAIQIYQDQMKEFEENFPEFDNSTPQGQFINEIARDAVEIAHDHQIYPSVMVAQAALESSWGQSGLAQEFNNLMGTKGSTQGVKLATTEFEGGVAYDREEYFSVYDSYTHSLEHYGQLLRQGTSDDQFIYQNTWRENADHYREVTASLVGVYATDPEYDQKLNATIESYNLDQLDDLRVPDKLNVSQIEV